jgi:hypothetical protein
LIIRMNFTDTEHANLQDGLTCLLKHGARDNKFLVTHPMTRSSLNFRDHLPSSLTVGSQVPEIIL